ncbi:MAG: hypothetical protein E7590_05055 [Ruminococcaceae bacterium]|nr:hypothetical protein [Oscillospiraceae bacterium]
MPQIVCNISLDVSVDHTEQTFAAKQGDSQSRLLCVTFTDCGKPLPIERQAVVLLNVKKGEETASFEGAVTEEGKALFVIPDFVLAEAGRVRCDVSAIGRTGGRLTTADFVIAVEETVAPGGELGSDAAISDLAAEFIASQRLLPLLPTVEGEGYLLSPAVNHKYTLDLSDSSYAPEGVWKPFRLVLPRPQDAARENWILIYCHAPLTAGGDALQITLDESCLLADGVQPSISFADFDLLCTYSAGAGAWQIGFVQYQKKG